MGLTRRKVLWSALGGVVLTGTYGVVKWFTAKPQDIIVAILHRRLGYLNLKGDDITKFSEDYLTEKAAFIRKLTVLSVFSDPLTYFTPYPFLPFGHAFRRMEDSIVSLFLLSTDFFQNDADEKRAIEYLGFYDPFNAICRNPLMRHSFSDQ